MRLLRTVGRARSSRGHLVDRSGGAVRQARRAHHSGLASRTISTMLVSGSSLAMPQGTGPGPRAASPAGPTTGRPGVIGGPWAIATPDQAACSICRHHLSEPASALQSRSGTTFRWAAGSTIELRRQATRAIFCQRAHHVVLSLSAGGAGNQLKAISAYFLDGGLQCSLLGAASGRPPATRLACPAHGLQQTA